MDATHPIYETFHEELYSTVFSWGDRDENFVIDRRNVEFKTLSAKWKVSLVEANEASNQTREETQKMPPRRCIMLPASRESRPFIPLTPSSVDQQRKRGTLSA